MTRDYISGIMHIHDADAFIARAPGAASIKRVPKVPLGIHERWSSDGHDKLYKIVWAVVVDTAGRWLGALVVPSNGMGHLTFIDILGLKFDVLFKECRSNLRLTAGLRLLSYWERSPGPRCPYSSLLPPGCS